MDYDYYERRIQKSESCIKACLRSLVAFMVIVIMVLLFGGCGTIKYVPVETLRTEYITKHDSVMIKDSVYLHDSVFVHAKNDTIFYERWRTKYIDKVREVLRTDTVIKTDSIQVPYPVEKKLSRWQQIKLEAGGYAIAIAIFILVSLVGFYFIRKRLRR